MTKALTVGRGILTQDASQRAYMWEFQNCGRTASDNSEAHYRLPGSAARIGLCPVQPRASTIARDGRQPEG